MAVDPTPTSQRLVELADAAPENAPAIWRRGIGLVISAMDQHLIEMRTGKSRAVRAEAEKIDRMLQSIHDQSRGFNPATYRRATEFEDCIIPTALRARAMMETEHDRS